MTGPVYLVDDDDAVRDALSLLLRTVGLPVRGFASPGHFLAALDELPPGCLVLDIRMPVISGLKLQEHLAGRGLDWPTVMSLDLDRTNGVLFTTGGPSATGPSTISASPWTSRT